MICELHSDYVENQNSDRFPMFSGIVEDIGTIEEMSQSEDGIEVRIKTGSLDLINARVGDSLLVNGICLTLTEIRTQEVNVFVSNETVSCTNFGSYSDNTAVNLEQSLTLDQRIGGHFVSGHVDGIVRCVKKVRDGASVRLEIEVTQSLRRFVAEKGSVTLDGVSLTINSVSDQSESTIFSVNLIPHTLEVTTLGFVSVGDELNIEVDLIARYVDRLRQFD